MTSFSLARRTTREISIPGLTILLPAEYRTAGAEFRVTRIVEELQEIDGRPVHYSVKCRGPIVTKKGDHATQRGEKAYDARRLPDAPEAVRNLLAGPDALRDAHVQNAD